MCGWNHLREEVSLTKTHRFPNKDPCALSLELYGFGMSSYLMTVTNAPTGKPLVGLMLRRLCAGRFPLLMNRPLPLPILTKRTVTNDQSRGSKSAIVFAGRAISPMWGQSPATNGAVW
jgi:hypothetical protein